MGLELSTSGLVRRKSCAFIQPRHPGTGGCDESLLFLFVVNSSAWLVLPPCSVKTRRRRSFENLAFGLGVQDTYTHYIYLSIYIASLELETRPVRGGRLALNSVSSRICIRLGRWPCRQSRLAAFLPLSCRNRRRRNRRPWNAEMPRKTDE